MKTEGKLIFGPLQIGIIILTLATALMHLALGVSLGQTYGFMGLPLAFVLNGLGYMVLLGGLYLPIAALAGRRSQIRWLLIAYTAVTILLYFVFNWPDVFMPGGLVNKGIEALLIVLLVVEGRR